jgi:hypothetical protein
LETLVAEIDAESRERKLSKSDVVRERLQAGARQERRPTALLDSVADLIGSVAALSEAFQLLGERGVPALATCCVGVPSRLVSTSDRTWTPF